MKRLSDNTILSDEILERNGFVLYEGEEDSFGFGVELVPYYQYENSPKIFCDGNPYAVWFEDEVEIRTVGDLRTLLKLCKIDKEII